MSKIRIPLGWVVKGQEQKFKMIDGKPLICYVLETRKV